MWTRSVWILSEKVTRQTWHALLMYFVFHSGADMYEMLPCSGIGEATPTDDVKSIEAIRKKRDKSNAALIKSLREDEHAGALLEATEADWIAGRMTEPVLVDEEIPVDVLLHPRFRCGISPCREEQSPGVRCGVRVVPSACTARRVFVCLGTTSPRRLLFAFLLWVGRHVLRPRVFVVRGAQCLSHALTRPRGKGCACFGRRVMVVFLAGVLPAFRFLAVPKFFPAAFCSCCNGVA